MKIEDIQGYDDYYVLSGGLEASPGPLERKTNHLLAKKILGRWNKRLGFDPISVKGPDPEQWLPKYGGTVS